MMTDPIRILFTSDLHFGDPAIPQVEMTKAFADTVFPMMADLDILFINGDFFDTLILFDDHGFDPLYDLILNLFALCDKHKIILRIMQGTWLHDRAQLQRLETFYHKALFSFDFRYINGIDLEEITVRDRAIRVFFVPDSLPFTQSDDIARVVDDRLVEEEWESVDYGCMHGFFDFTFPKGVKQDNVVVYKAHQFPFVKKLIDVGHVHQHRIYAKQSDNEPDVISNGSFDRSCHGDEMPKGCVRVWDYPDHYTAQFIENKDAAVFDTLTFGADDTTESIREVIQARLDQYITQRQIELRFITTRTDHRDAIKTWMKETHPKVRCGFKKADDKAEPSALLASNLVTSSREKRMPPTPGTIAQFVRDHIPTDYHLSLEAIDQYLEPPAG